MQFLLASSTCQSTGTYTFVLNIKIAPSLQAINHPRPESEQPSFDMLVPSFQNYWQNAGVVKKVPI